MAKYLDYDGLLYFWGKLKEKFVTKETGKGLSTNDLTNELLTKLNELENYTLPEATDTVLGGVKIGTGLSITAGVLNAVQGSYTLPTASATTLGGIKVGTNLSISDGVLSTAGEANTIENVKVNGIALAITSKAVNIDLSGYALSATTLAGYGITNAYTKTEVDAKVTSVLAYGGSVAFASLPTPSESVARMVYNVTDAFTTTDKFLEGAGHTYPAGTNVAIALKDGTYYYDAMSGFVDLSPYLLIASTISNTDIDTIVAA